MKDFTPSMIRVSQNIQRAAGEVSRYGLVCVLLWIGFMKFTSYEAHGIEAFIANSPFMSWLYKIMSVQAASSLIGVAEIITALLLAAGAWSARLSLLGGLGAAATFLTTLTFLVTTPQAWEASLGGFPALSIVGQFVLKDLLLLAASLRISATALEQVARQSQTSTSTVYPVI